MASGVQLEAAVVITIGRDCVIVPKSNASIHTFPYDFSIFRDSQKITRVSRVLRWHWSFERSRSIETTRFSPLLSRAATEHPLTYTMTGLSNGHVGKRKAGDITFDEVDGFSAAQLFGQGTCDVVSDKSAL